MDMATHQAKGELIIVGLGANHDLKQPNDFYQIDVQPRPQEALFRAHPTWPLTHASHSYP